IDPLEIFLVGELMPSSFLGFRPGASLAAAVQSVEATWHGAKQRLANIQRLYPILDDTDHLIGVVTRQQLLNARARLDADSQARIEDLMVRHVIVGYQDMTLRELANLMAEQQVSSVPIVDRMNARRVISVMALDQVLEARLRDLDEEHKSERVINWLQILPLDHGSVLVRRETEQSSDAEPDRGARPRAVDPARPGRCASRLHPWRCSAGRCCARG